MATRPRLPRLRLTRGRRRDLAGLVAAWLLVAAPTGALLFLHGSRSIVLAGHDAVVRPSLDGYATLDLGPYVPNFRYPTGSRLGARIDLGKTTVDSYGALMRRYAFIASQPEGQIKKLRSTMIDLAVDSAVAGGLLGLCAPGLVLLVGRRRWAQLFDGLSVRRTAGATVAVVVVGFGLAHPWDADDPAVEHATWESLPSVLSDVPIPEEARALQVETGLMTSGTRRLVESAVESYRKSLDFYRSLADRAPGLAGELHQPGPGEVVALLVSDRHDNVGMDPVARAIADQGKATFLLDAGDDTSTGGSWEAFSLESLDQAFDDYDERVSVAGNHDNGDFVADFSHRLGFTALAGEVVDGPDGIRLLGANDPRSSGLGGWRDQHGDAFADQRTRLADVACRHDADGDRVTTLLVHDASSGSEALARGCVDLVLAGHLHEQVGPTAVVGSNGRTGYSYTTGTTGGAAYAVAIGSKLRRDAEVTLVTYRAGVPVGLQPVVIRTTGNFVVGGYLHLDYPPVSGTGG